jgi:hypothetical protein
VISGRSGIRGRVYYKRDGGEVKGDSGWVLLFRSGLFTLPPGRHELQLKRPVTFRFRGIRVPRPHLNLLAAYRALILHGFDAER